MTKINLLILYLFLFQAVQHERAPRSCIINQQHLPLNNLTTAELYNSATRRLPLTTSCGLFLPIPLQQGVTNTSSSSSSSSSSSLRISSPKFPSFRYMPAPGTIGHPFTSHFHSTNGGGFYFSNPLTSNAITENILGNLPTSMSVPPTLPPPPPITPIIPIPVSVITTGSGKEDEVTSTDNSSTSNNSSLKLLTPTTTTTTAMPINPKREAVFESAAKLLFLAVKWARSVPSFIQLPNRDQSILLEESWAELFVITAAQWGFNIGDILPKENGVKFLQKAIHQFTTLRIDHTESACLKALILFKPESTGLSSIHQIISLQEQTLNLLYEKCGGVRLGHVLLILPLIKSAANPQILQEMFFKGTVGEVAIERLLGDLMNT